MKAFWLILCFVATCGWSTAQAREQVDETRPFADNGRLEVSIVSGSVEVRGWNRPEIRVSGTLESKNDQLRFDVSDSDAFVSVFEEREHRGRRRERRQDGDANLVIQVPRATRLSIVSVSAEIDVSNTSLFQRLESVSGDIQSTLQSSEGKFRTVSGQIKVEVIGNSERVEAHSVSGDIDIRGVSGEIRLETVSGDLDVTAKRFSRLDVHTVSGDLDLTGNFASGGEISAESVNGDMRLELPSLYNTEIHLESFNGDIAKVFDYRAVRNSRYAPGRTLRLTEGDGISRIRIETLNGDIDLLATGGRQRAPRISQTGAQAYRSGPGNDGDDNHHDDHDSHHHDDDDSDHGHRWNDTGDFDEAMKALEKETRKSDRESTVPDGR